jgi:ParB/RepB/Spo0J family partition protein
MRWGSKMKESTDDVSGTVAGIALEDHPEMTRTEVVQIPLVQLVESLTNPRKTFDEGSLDELAESIKQCGIRQPLTVRPCSARLVERLSGKVTFEGDAEQTYEIVIGARRFRAAKKAGLSTVPCLVSDAMEDQEAAEIQIVENLQREDIGAIEEAEGFKRLMESHGIKVAGVAERVGKSTRYIYDRLTLVSRLADEVRALAEMGYLPPSHMVELARLDLRDQQKALCDLFEVYGDSAKDLVEKIRSGEEDGRTPALRDLKSYIEREILHALSAAPWDLQDASLIPAHGSCSGCSYRSDRTFDQTGPIDGTDGCCMRPECFTAKKVAFIRRKADEIGTDDEKVVAVQSTYGHENDEAAVSAGLNKPLAQYEFEKAKKSDKGAVQAIDVSTGKAIWIKTSEKVGQRDDERAEQIAARKKELAKERAEVERREQLMACIMKAVSKNTQGVVRTLVDSLGWNMSKDKEVSHLRVLFLAGMLGNVTEEQAKDLDFGATMGDLVKDGGPESLSRLLVLWHCREEFYAHYGEPETLNELAKVLEIDPDNPSVEVKAEEPESIPAVEIAASSKKARGKASKKGKKRKGRK